MKTIVKELLKLWLLEMSKLYGGYRENTALKDFAYFS